MDPQHYAGLVYQQHAQPLPADSSHTGCTVNNNPHSMSWHAGHHSPSNSTSSSAQSSQMYSVMNRSSDNVQYAGAQASPPFMTRHPHSGFPAAQQSPTFGLSPSDQDMGFSTRQLESSIGPNRILTRRRARAALGQAESSGASGHGFERPPHSLGFPPQHMSRPQTPSSLAHTTQYSPHTEVQTGGSHFPPPVPSPVYSPYTFFPTHSRSTSGSGSTSNPRSASPALSIASALTSVSSSASAPNSQTFSMPPPDSPMGIRPKHKKTRLSNFDRKKICVYHKEHPNVKQEEVARIFNVERSTVSKILKHKAKWMNVPEEDTMVVIKHRPSKFPYLEMRLSEWLIECKKNNTILTDALIRNKAKEVAKSMNWPEDKFKASSGWVENFKHRHGIRKGVWHGLGKNTKIARALGCGPTPEDYDPIDTSSSELPGDFPKGFLEQQGIEPDLPGDVSAQNEYDDDMGAESEEDCDIGEGMSRDALAGPSAMVTLQPAWPRMPTSHENQPAGDAGARMPLAHDPEASVAHRPDHHRSHMDHSVPNAHEQLPMSLPQPQAVPVPMPPSEHGKDGPNGFDYVNVVPYIPSYRQGPPVPSAEEVQAAIDKIMVFADAHGKEVINDQDRGALSNIKCAVFGFANGVAYDRDPR